MDETIFAQATPRGRAGIAVIRISGPEAFAAVARLTGERPRLRRAVLRWLRDPATGEPIDQGIVLGFPGPASFTGEDVVELQVHGSPAVTRALLAVLGEMHGLRPAEPGEFTRCALMNGRLDLAQVEGLGDLVAAETLAQRRQAVRLMDGALSRTAAGWRAAMVRALAHIEVSIDFADEDLPGDLLAQRRDLGGVIAEMERELAGSRIAERLRGGFEVALVGRPNVGKSTLLNALAGREAALTSEIAGTTRDVIEVCMELDGLPVTLLDMAGLRSSDGVEALGIARARQRAALADLRVFLVDTRDEAAGLGIGVADGDLVVLAKADLRTGTDGLAVSGTTGSGINAVLGALSAELGRRASLAATVSHERQVQAVIGSLTGVRAAHAELARPEPAVEIIAEELQAALRALDFLVGKVDVEAVLDVVFANFCLGK